MHLITTQGNPLHLDPEDAHLLEGLTLREDKGGLKAHSRTHNTNMSVARIIAGLPPGDPRHVRHRDGDRLNCRRENLMLVTREKSYSLRDRTASSEAGRQRMTGRNVNPNKTTSEYRGVTKVHPNGVRTVTRYQSRITLDGRTRSLGLFETQEDAARAYDRARERAGLEPVNFPPEF